MMNKILVTEDQALGMNISLEQLLNTYQDQGYVIDHHYNHPAVGKCYVLIMRENDEPTKEDDSDYNYYESLN